MKLLIVGIVATGKTTLAKKLSFLLGIKHYEIDSVVHDNKTGKKRSVKEQEVLFKKINKEKDWIIEGTLRKHLFYLCEMADKIIYLDVPINVRKVRILVRFIKQKLGIEKCNYKVDFNILKLMYKWTSDFEKDKSVFLEKLHMYDDKLIIVDAKKIII